MLVPTVSLTLAITGALVAVSFAMSRDALRNVINDQLTAISESTVNQVEHWLVSQQENLGLWASQPESLAALDPNPAGDQIRHAIEEQLARAAKAYGCFEFIQIADINGAAIVSSDPSAELRKINVADREYFKQAAAGRSVVSDVLASRKSGNPVVVLATPIKAGTEVRGVLFAVVDLNWFSKEVIARITVLNTGYACLFDHQGRVLAHPDRTKLLKTKLTDFEWGGPLLERHEGQFDYVIDGVHKHAAFKTSDRLGWGVMVTVPDSEVNAPFLRLGRISLLLSIVAVIAGAVLMFFVARSVSDPIQRIAGQLAVGADQTAGAAREVSEASQALAAGASEQAAAVEQSISSLEMLSSVTTHNADSAVQVSALAKQAREAADNGTSDMRAMNNAINEIKASSHQVEQIIKTIDEIAFQTNILALNAAVEAARAGDAGAGFAVVADEVRHLAQRASQAANDTTIKIQGAIAKTAQGVELDRKVAQAFEAIATRTRQVEELATAVATASREQARSISEVSLAVRQMETVVQRNAASAEEAAGASQEMDAQAEVVRDSVFQLFRVVGGDRSVSSGVPVPAPHTAASRSVLPEQSTAPAMPSPNEHALSAPRQPVSEMRRPTPLPPLRRD